MDTTGHIKYNFCSTRDTLKEVKKTVSGERCRQGVGVKTPQDQEEKINNLRAKPWAGISQKMKQMWPEKHNGILNLQVIRDTDIETTWDVIFYPFAW